MAPASLHSSTRCWVFIPRPRGAPACAGSTLTLTARRFDRLSGTCLRTTLLSQKCPGSALFATWQRFPAFRPRKRLIELIREIREASDICLLLSSHLLRDVEETCDEVLILRNGKIASICDLVEERRANRKFLELETIGAEATFTSTLEGLGCECAVFTNGRMKVVMPESVEIREVFKVAADKGVQIRRMNHRRDSLEDIFLNAMEQTGATDGRI